GGLGEPGDGLGDVDRLAALLQGVDASADLPGRHGDPRRHLGLDEPGGDGVDRDATGGQPLVRAHRPDQPDDAGLGGGVVGLAAVAGDAGGGGDADDPSAVVQPAGQVGVEEDLVDPDLGGQVDLQHAAPPLLVGVDEQPVAGDA